MNMRVIIDLEGTKVTLAQIIGAAQDAGAYEVIAGGKRYPLEQKDERLGGGWIYFARCGDFIKIGFTTSINTRFEAFRTANPHSPELLGAMPGDLSTERKLHAKFAAFRHRREWFRADPDLLSKIAEIIKPRPIEL